jgi:predicted dienelactone hydrolase
MKDAQKKSMRNFLFVFVVMFMFFIGETLYSAENNYNVGLDHVETSIQPENIKMHMMVWYPTSNITQMTKVGLFEINVARNAEIEHGDRSLVLISHGDGGSHLGHRDTAHYLAKKGFIVVTILHPHNNYTDNAAEGTHQNWVDRPRHMSKAIDTLLEHDKFKAVTNHNSIAVVGYYTGAYTALAIAGGIADTSNIRAHCQNNTDDFRFCKNYGMYSKTEREKGNTVIKNPGDKRIKALVLMAPVGVLFKDKKSLSNVKIPVRIYRAQKDQILSYPYHAAFIKENLPLPPEYIVVKNAGHHSFISPLPDYMKSKAGEIGIDPEGFDRNYFHERMNREIANFLLQTLGAKNRVTP